MHRFAGPSASLLQRFILGCQTLQNRALRRNREGHILQRRRSPWSPPRGFENSAGTSPRVDCSCYVLFRAAFGVLSARRAHLHSMAEAGDFGSTRPFESLEAFLEDRPATRCASDVKATGTQRRSRSGRRTERCREARGLILSRGSSRGISAR